jgi:hypothetical protein
LYGSVVPQSRPWPPGTTAAQRTARIVAASQFAGAVIGAGVVFYVLGFTGPHRDVAFGGILTGVLFVLAIGATWLVYHARKIAVIKRSRSLRDPVG